MTSASASAPVTLEREGHVAYITLNVPPVHALNLDALAALDRAVREACEATPAAAVLVLRASGGKCFSAGVDIRDHTPDKVERMLSLFHGALWRLHTARAATVAILNGPALGGGAELAMVCDMLVASENATFGFPEINVGCFPPVAMALLASRIGHHRAAEMILTGDAITAARALEIGLVNRVAPAERLEEETKILLAKFAEKSPAVLGLTARGVRKMWDFSFERALREAERVYKEELMKCPDMEEGVRAFMEKRKPKWKS